ncbi:peptidoglycan-associated lipoprotein Pal [Dentiradicibacter hellwigii]|jgi:peptidoglycan-associated lipoprotein|uniref:Peptidoglycan-associated lipoprotein n=1 Tax=Dentiradicibacter hellwigii TaxID=3149053 RepID=A0ABV4UBJ5_9RHOO
MKQLVIPALLALLIAGCSSTPDADQANAPVEDGRGKVATVEAGNVNGSKLPRELTDPKSILSRRSIFFDYDRFDVKDEYRELVTAHARFLSNNRQFKMLIQGNTDERGSREYNLALGQKRADAVKRMLVMLGVREDQVESVSLGEEKPRSEGHDEAAWAENRRSDMLYSGEF